jgi:hypothetical protein
MSNVLIVTIPGMHSGAESPVTLGKIFYKEFLDYFFMLHDPSAIDHQGNNTGSGYWSVIFTQDANLVISHNQSFLLATNLLENY